MSREGDQPSPKELAQDLARLEGGVRSSMSDMGKAQIGNRLLGEHHDLAAMKATEEAAQKALASELRELNDMGKKNPELLKAILAETRAIDNKSGYLPEVEFQDGHLVRESDYKRRPPADCMCVRG